MIKSFWFFNFFREIYMKQINNKINSTLNSVSTSERMKMGGMLLLKTVFELKTFYYASIFVGLILFTYSITMSSVLYNLHYDGMAHYYNLVAVIAFAPAFIINNLLLDDYLKSNSFFLLNKIINSIVFAIYGGAIILSGYLIFKTSVEHLKLIGYFSEIIFIVGFFSLLLKDVNIGFNKLFIYKTQPHH